VVFVLCSKGTGLIRITPGSEIRSEFYVRIIDWSDHQFLGAHVSSELRIFLRIRQAGSLAMYVLSFSDVCFEFLLGNLDEPPGNLN
jgi:hypothetical protein